MIRIVILQINFKENTSKNKLYITIKIGIEMSDKNPHKQMTGLSTAESLIEVWNKWKSDREPDLVVSWEFKFPDETFWNYSTNSPGKVYIMNMRSVYDSKVTGHWTAMILTKTALYYCDPFGCILTKKHISRLLSTKPKSFTNNPDIKPENIHIICESINKVQNFTGQDSDSCGYYCIMFLLSWLRRKQFGYKYSYVVFDMNTQKFIDTIPNNRKLRINIDAMVKEIDANSSLV